MQQQEVRRQHVHTEAKAICQAGDTAQILDAVMAASTLCPFLCPHGCISPTLPNRIPNKSCLYLTVCVTAEGHDALT